MGLRVALEWLGSCSGCEIAFLNMGEGVLQLLSEGVDIVHAPLLMDNKYCDPASEEGCLELPEADLGFISGCLNNTEHFLVLQEMRKKCKKLVALGTCATHGGIPAMMNSWEVREGLDEVYQTSSTDPGSSLPHEGLPEPLDRVYGCDEQAHIDLLLPGCPPNPQQIMEVIRAELEKREVRLPERSVCDSCPVERKGKGSVGKVKRFLSNASYSHDTPLDNMRCLLEQGFLCLGPVTRSGCGGAKAPNCIRARVPCRGCYGPVRKEGNQMLDMMNAMASNNIDYKTVVDRRSMLRFSGSHGRLRPLKRKKKR